MRSNVIGRLASVLAIAAVVSACGSSSPSAATSPAATAATAATAASEAATSIPAGGTLEVIGPWRANPGAVFQGIIDQFTATTGIHVQYEGVDSVTQPLASRLAAGSPPDLAILAGGENFLGFVKQAALMPLNDLKTDIAANIDQGWIDSLSIKGNIYAVPLRINTVSLLWYNPVVLTTLGVKAPTTWDELIATCDTIEAAGKSCFSFTASAGWPLMDLFDTLYMTTYGAAKHRDLFTGKVPFTDQTVADTLNRLVTMCGDKYAAGGAKGVLGTDLVPAIARVFGPKADSVFITEGNYVGTIALASVDSSLTFGKTLDFVPFPTSPQAGKVVSVASDMLAMLKDSAAARAFVKYMISDAAAVAWSAKGYNMANKHMDASKYTDPLAAKVATVTQSATPEWVALPGDMATQWTQLLQAVLLDPTKTSSLLAAFQPKAQALFGQ
jgi:alpha-glucoside transport system substrate-binding protein